MTPPFDIARVNAAIVGTIFHERLRHMPTTGSTNSDALEAAAAGAPEGEVFLADLQTAGRGRAGHSWVSPPRESIHCSLLLRPRLEGADVLLLSLVAGMAVRNAVQEATGLNADLRWPNDLLLEGRKFSGILTELSANAAGNAAVVGIGINVNQQSFPPELAEVATSLGLVRGEWLEREAVLAGLLRHFDSEYRTLNGAGDAKAARAALLARFTRASSYACGRRVRVEDSGQPPFEGTTAGLDERGFLRVQTAEGIRTVLSGGVRPLPE